MGMFLHPLIKPMATCHLFEKNMHPLSLSIVRILIMATCLKILLMTFLYILELRLQKITNAYHQLVGFLSYIKIEPKVYLLLQLQHVLWKRIFNQVISFNKQCSNFRGVNLFGSILTLFRMWGKKASLPVFPL